MLDTGARTTRGAESPTRWDVICPYLLDAGGTWRATRPSTEHRCTAVLRPVPLNVDKQRRLCLGGGYPDCPAFQAARDARATALGPAAEPTRGGRRVYARGAAIVLERPGPFSLALSFARESLPQVVLILMMLLAAAALVFARFAGP